MVKKARRFSDKELNTEIHWYDKEGYYYGSNTIKNTALILGLKNSRVVDAINNQDTMLRGRYLVASKKMPILEGGYKHKYKNVKKQNESKFPLHSFTPEGLYIKTYTNQKQLNKDVKPSCIGNINRSLDLLHRTEDGRVWTTRDMKTRESQIDFGKVIKKVRGDKTRKVKEVLKGSAENGVSIYTLDGLDTFIFMAHFKTLEDATKMLKLRVPPNKINKLKTALPYRFGNYLIAPKDEDNETRKFLGKYNDFKTFKL